MVDDAQCSAEMLPEPREESCEVTCATDCALSDWSPWQPESCAESDRVRSRRRLIIGHPVATALPCPDQDELVQVDKCETAADDFRTYSWLPMPWAECRAATPPADDDDDDEGDDGDAPSDVCQRGVELRQVRCVRDDVEHVDDAWSVLILSLQLRNDFDCQLFLSILMTWFA